MAIMNKVERYRHTPKGVLTNIYAAQRRNSPIRGFGPVGYTLGQLHERFLTDPTFLSLYEAWAASGCPYSQKPSIDRINPLGGYTLDNIQIVTWAANHSKGAAEACLTKGKPVIQMSAGGALIERFGSVKEAAQKTGVCRSSIPKVCSGRFNQCGGFRWTWAV